MSDTKLKYVRLEKYNTIIIFPQILNHSDFKHMKPISAGFCYIYQNKIKCFGHSYSLNLESNPEDTIIATKQILGIDNID